MRMIAYLLSGILCALLASSIASAQDKCAPLINDAAKYQTCRMNEVGRNIREREKGTRDWAVTIILSGGTTIMMAGGEESKAA